MTFFLLAKTIQRKKIAVLTPPVITNIFLRPALLILLACFLMLLSCKSKSDSAGLFAEVPSSHSGIHFSNNLKENEDYNIDTYEYLYNGGGVGVGDVNNDGLQDILFTGNMVPDKLYLNKGDMQFEDITGQSGFTSRSKWKTGVAMVDVNGDQLQDIYLCYSGPGTDEERSNQLYINTGITGGIPHFQRISKRIWIGCARHFYNDGSFF